MSKDNTVIAKQRKMLIEAEAKGGGAALKTYFRLSGPGWLQSAITLGGGSLASALFLGIIGGYSFLWLQVVAILLGVIMLSAISYVSLSAKEKPFPAINKHISPVLGWGWAIATLMANIVWCLPQFSLSTAAIQQNLIPSLAGTGGKIFISLTLLVFAVTVIWFYDKEGKGKQIFDWILKILVGLIVLSFVGVVVKLATSAEGLPFGEILKGYVPNLSSFTKPAESFLPFLSQVGGGFQSFWSGQIVSMQTDVMLAAASAAVGINMTFLLPYSMLARGWDKNFRKMAIFDLSVGMVVPFLLVTSCVVIASASQFHAKPDVTIIEKTDKLHKGYKGYLTKRVKAEAAETGVTLSPVEIDQKIQALPLADKQLASMLVKRNAFSLAKALSPLLGETYANFIFGLGVLGMGFSTIIVLMLISGFVICEIFNLPQDGPARRWGSMLPAVGVLGPFVWSKAAFYLAIPTSIFGLILLPVAYFSFLFMMNSKKIMGDAIPTGSSKTIWNTLMGIACVAVSIAVFSGMKAKGGTISVVAFTLMALFIVAVIVSHLMIRNKSDV